MLKWHKSGSVTPMRLFFAFILMLAGGFASAEWVKYGELDGNSYYYDPATIRRDGSLRRVWELQDLKQRGAIGELSRRGLIENDCRQERYRVLSLQGFPENMEKGKLLGSGNSPSEWRHVAPRTIAQELLKIVCAQ